MTIRASATDAGCWIDGHWGQYSGDRLVDIAVDHGFDPGDDEGRLLVEFSLFRLNHNGPLLGTDEEKYDNLLARLLPNIDPKDRQAEEWQVFERQTWLVDEAEIWMNEVVAPEGYRFLWEDGEFFLTEISEEEDDDGDIDD